MMNPDPFPALVQQFFADFLPKQRNVSPNTIAAYRDAFRLLLAFLSDYHRKPIDTLTLGHLSGEAVLAFLAHLEKTRGNAIHTRNVRLAAVRSFARYALGHAAPEFFVHGQRLLSIPVKKAAKPRLGYMSREEIAALLGATANTWSGQRDHLLFTLLYNTGARISEALAMRGSDINGRSVVLHGKGRKTRNVPLWPQTLRRLRTWSRKNALRPDQPIFANHRGAPLSRDGAAFRLDLALHAATQKCPSLATRRITPHTLRHTTAMHLLQSGVPLEVIALWLGHEHPLTTHTYVEADMKIKTDCLRRLEAVAPPAGARRKRNSNLLSFLEAL
jgi:integrase/recombinase XerD